MERRVRDAPRPLRLPRATGEDVSTRNNPRRRFGLTQDAGYDAVASLSRRWQPHVGLVYFHLLLDALAARGGGYLEEAR